MKALTLLGFALVTLSAQQAPQGTFRPAQYAGGSLPLVPVQAIAGGQVLLELAVTKTGAVADVKTLRTTPPFTAQFVAAAQSWRFRPAERLTESVDGSRPPAWLPIESTVLVGGVIRPPTMNTPTLGESPRDIGSEADDTPFPLSAAAPLFPPRALGDGSVLVQVMIDTGGRVSDAKILQPSPAFNEVALTAARSWVFRPARVRGESVATYAYLVFAFRSPVTGAPGTSGTSGTTTTPTTPTTPTPTTPTTPPRP
jgi:TonB family protein